MTVSEAKSRIVARIWQSIAASGAPVTAIPQDQLETLVNSIADGVLVALDGEIEELGRVERTVAVTDAPLAEEEKVLWEGRPFLSLITNYRITNQRVRVISGIVGKDYEDLELIRIQDIDRSQGITERVLGIGDILIRSHDPSHAEIVLQNIADPNTVHEILRSAMLDARTRFRYSVQEEM